MQLGSCDCSKTELDLQAVPPTMTTMQDCQWVDYHPIASLDNSFSAPIEFVVPSHTEDVDFPQTLLYVKIRILKESSGELEAEKKVVPINNFIHSLFIGIGLDLNNKLVTKNTDTYPYTV